MGIGNCEVTMTDCSQGVSMDAFLSQWRCGQWFKQLVTFMSEPSFIMERICGSINCLVSDVLINWRRVTHTTWITRTRWRHVKTLGQHQVGVNLQSHAQHQLWISTWHIFHEFHKIMPSLSYAVSLVNQNVILVNISHWRLHMAWIMSLMST